MARIASGCKQQPSLAPDVRWPRFQSTESRASSFVTQSQTLGTQGEKAAGNNDNNSRRSSVDSSSPRFLRGQLPPRSSRAKAEQEDSNNNSTGSSSGGGGTAYDYIDRISPLPLEVPLRARLLQSPDHKSSSSTPEEGSSFEEQAAATTTTTTTVVAPPVSRPNNYNNNMNHHHGVVAATSGERSGEEGDAVSGCTWGGSSSGGSRSGGEEVNLNLSLSGFPDLAFLAQGAMCKCFVTKKNPLFPSSVVLKMAIENGPEEAERDLNRELALLQNLSHPMLAALLGAGITPKGKTFIVMEYLDGGTLRRRLDKARGGLGFWPAARYALELASAMKYLHDEAIPGTCVMHRDLKPDNLGFRGNVMKLFDFGLAKLIRRSDDGVNDFYRMSGEVGSLRYMSPEVASLQPYNEKADVHSFAVVMWELVTGWLPFAGLTPQQYMYQVVQHGQRPLMQFGWDPRFKGLLASCWAEDPRERPSFSQIHDTLEALVADGGAAAKPSRGGRASADGNMPPRSRSSLKGGVLSRLFSKKSKATTKN